MTCVFCGSNMSDGRDKSTCSCGAYHYNQWQGNMRARLDRWGGVLMQHADPVLTERYLDGTYNEYRRMRTFTTGILCWACDNAACNPPIGKKLKECEDYLKL